VAISRRPLFLSVSILRLVSPHGPAQRNGGDRSSVAVPLYGAVQVTDQSVFVEGLGQEAKRSLAERLSAGVFVGDGGDEYEWNPVSPAAQMRLELDAAHRRHTDVSDDTPGMVQFGRLQEGLGGSKRKRRVAERPDEIVEPGANRVIIVND
jgi:hypothetical protein